MPGFSLPLALTLSLSFTQSCKTLAYVKHDRQTLGSNSVKLKIILKQYKNTIFNTVLYYKTVLVKLV